MGAGPDPRLIAIIGELDRTFSQDRADEMGRFYSEDARLMWPALEDVIGRTKIQDAFQRLVGAYSTIRWEPQREFVLSTDDRAVAIGRFIEIRKRREDNQVEQVHGRLVEVWQLEADGEWRLSVLMTSRYAENALTGKEATGSGDNRVRNR